MTNMYFAWVDSLPYIFMRNYQDSTIHKKIDLKEGNYPTCINFNLFKNIELDEDADVKKKVNIHKDLLVSIGTKNG